MSGFYGLWTRREIHKERLNFLYFEPKTPTLLEASHARVMLYQTELRALITADFVNMIKGTSLKMKRR